MSVLLYADDDAPKETSPTIIIPRWFCRLLMLTISCRYCILVLLMLVGLVLNSAQDNGLHLIGESAGDDSDVLELVL